jgi:hypothetical protein
VLTATASKLERKNFESSELQTEKRTSEDQN